MKGVNFANTFSRKLFYRSNAWEKETTPTFFLFDGYDDPHNAMLSEADDTFCDASGFAPEWRIMLARTLKGWGWNEMQTTS